MTEQTSRASQDEARSEGPRTLNELMVLKTFQGMSDEEIALVIAERERIAKRDDEHAARVEAIRRESQAEAEAFRSMAANARARFDELVRAPLDLKTEVGE